MVVESQIELPEKGNDVTDAISATQKDDFFHRVLPEIFSTATFDNKANLWIVSPKTPLVFPTGESGLPIESFRTDFPFFRENSCVHGKKWSEINIPSSPDSGVSSPVVTRSSSPIIHHETDFDRRGSSSTDEGFSEVDVYQDALAAWIAKTAAVNPETAATAASRVANQWDQACLGLITFVGSACGKHLGAAKEGKSFSLELDGDGNPIVTFTTKQLTTSDIDEKTDEIISQTVPAVVASTFRFESNRVVFLGAKVSTAAMEVAGLIPAPSIVSVAKNAGEVTQITQAHAQSNRGRAMAGIGLSGATAGLMAMGVLIGVGAAIPVVGWALLGVLAVGSAVLAAAGLYQHMQAKHVAHSAHNTYEANAMSDAKDPMAVSSHEQSTQVVNAASLTQTATESVRKHVTSAEPISLQPAVDVKPSVRL